MCGKICTADAPAVRAFLDEVSRVLKITDGVMRHGAFRRVKDGHTKAPSQVPVAAPAAAASGSDDDTDSGSE
jgi:hypothetical protein